MSTDYLIVGQGLAGSILARHFLERGKSVRLIGDQKLTNSSLVAGGLYNPITGRKMVKTWNCDKLFSYLTPFYQSLEKELGDHFLHEVPIYRPFLDIEAQNEWMGKSVESAFDAYVDKIYTKSANPELKDNFGGIMLKQCGYLDVKGFVESYGRFLSTQGYLLDEPFDYDALSIQPDLIVYKGIKAKGVVFCEGVNVLNNPLFKWLPFRPVKGELLTIKTDHLPAMIYNRGVFVIGKENQTCTVGATYDHSDLTLKTTERAKEQLVEKLEKLINFDYSIVHQKAGIRPATKDRKPLIGVHPKHENVYIFNGLGAKGVSLGPYYANQLVDFIVDKLKLDEEVNIERYFSLF